MNLSPSQIALGLRGVNAMQGLALSRKQRKLAQKLLLSRDQRKQQKAKKIGEMADRTKTQVLSDVGARIQDDGTIVLDTAYLDGLVKDPSKKKVCEDFLQQIASKAMRSDSSLQLEDVTRFVMGNSSEFLAAVGCEEDVAELSKQVMSSLDNMIAKSRLSQEELDLIMEG